LLLEFSILGRSKLVKEKDQSDDIRLYIDVQFLNRKIVSKVNNNLPLLHDIIDKLGQFKWITVIDLADSYYQFPVKQKNQQKLAFIIDETSMFAVLPFGIKIMLGILQRTMEDLLSDLEVPPFLNDIAMHCSQRKTILQKLEKCFANSLMKQNCVSI
jgi:hypothetical protein